MDLYTTVECTMRGVTGSVDDANLGELAVYSKKRGKRSKRHVEKDVYKDLFQQHQQHQQQSSERTTANPSFSSLLQQRKYYENIQYLSKSEKEQFESKFCKPRNPSQRKLAAFLNDQTKKIVIATGPAGTGKTLFTAQTAIRNFLVGTSDKIIFTRPSVSVDEELGFLPGTLEEKMAPWMRPLYDILYQHITPKEVTYLVEEKIIEICPLGFMRGRTFKNCCIVADEMQNCTQAQMKMLLTRIGENTRLFITGDLEQCDRHNERNGLEDFLDKIRGRRSHSISSVEFEVKDVEREDVVKEVLDIYSMDTMTNNYCDSASESGHPREYGSIGSPRGSGGSLTESEIDVEQPEYQE